MAVNIYQAVKQAMQDLIAPQLESVRGEIVALRAEMSGTGAALRGEMDGLRSETKGMGVALRAEMDGLRGEMNGLRGELNGLRGETTANFARLDERLTIALDLRERIVALEARFPR